MIIGFNRLKQLKGIKLLLVGVFVGLIAFGSSRFHLVEAVESQHPLPATSITALKPSSFGEPIPGIVTRGVDNQNLTEEIGLVSSASAPSYMPQEEIIPADPTNYGTRYLTDIHGNPATYPLLVVLHETVGSANSAINLFRTPHPRDADQVSYHSLIRRNGSIVHLVHPQMRAYGAGNSVFNGPNGPETTRTNPDFPPSVNNFAFHISLETPNDGRGNQQGHSGYTQAQYQSLAWLVARLPVPDERITTHQVVDRSGSRRDPRSFNREEFLRFLHTYPRSFENFARPT